MTPPVLLMAPRPRRTETRLPPGLLELHSELIVDRDLRGDPSGSILRMAADFRGRAAIVVRGSGIRLREFAIEGNRDASDVRAGLPPYDVAFARFTTANGILVSGASDVTIERVRLSSIAGFAVLVTRSRQVTID